MTAAQRLGLTFLLTVHACHRSDEHQRKDPPGDTATRTDVVPADTGPADSGLQVDTRDSGTGDSADSGAATWRPSCPLHPCAADLMAARFTDPASPGRIGSSILALDGSVVVGAPNSPLVGGDLPRIYVLGADDLAGGVSCHGAKYQNATGAALAAGDLDTDGVVDLVVSAPLEATSTVGGVVYVTSGVPTTDPDVRSSAFLVFEGYFEERLGAGIAVLALNGEGRVELVAGGGGVVNGPGGSVHGIDPALRGTLGPDDASWTISGDIGFGGAVLGWDGDGDGIDDLVTQGEDDTVARFASPLNAVVSDQAETRWATSGPEPDFLPLADLGDVTGDGLADLGLGDKTFRSSVDRGGAAYVVEGGDVLSKDAAAISLQWQGTTTGEAWGASMTSADFDGDGQLDLVVGADGLWPGKLPGMVTGYLGPLTSLDPAGAAFVVYGSDDWTLFGIEVASADADGDGRADLYVGATGDDENLGAVYLFTASGLLP